MEAQKAAKVLLVEDDATMRSVLSTLLEIEGFTVATIPDHKTIDEIVALMKSEKPDVILMDVHIRQVNGIDILKKMRLEPEIQAVKVYMASGMDMKQECLSAGANGFLMKPFMPDELIDLIRS
jgi:CheY-like chemotaxis protein